MKKNSIISLFLVTVAGMFASCQQDLTFEKGLIKEPGKSIETVENRAYGDKTPKIAVYVETNDVNPLNAGDYCMDNSKFVDIVILFASNIHKESNGDPTIYLNPELTPVLEPSPAGNTTTGFYKYVKPLQNMGIKVLLGILGDHKGIGVSNLNATQADHFAKVIKHVVNRYGLDGVDFDDEYSKVTNPVSGSYGRIIDETRAKLPNSLITAFAFSDVYIGWSGTSLNQIGQNQGAKLDYAYANFGWDPTPDISGVTNAHWAPLSINLGQVYTQQQLNNFKTQATNTATGGYGAIMFFNLRTRNDVDPLPVFDAIAQGAWGKHVVVCPPNGGNQSCDAGTVTGGKEFTYSGLPANEK